MKTAKDIMSKNLVTLSPEETIQKVTHTMEKYDVKEIPLIDDKKKLVGMVTYYDILDFVRADPNEKISNLKFMPPTVEKDTPIDDVASLILQTAVEAIPVIDGNSVLGIISDYDLLTAFKNDPKLKSLKVRDVMEDEVNLLTADDTISGARRIMRFKNWDRLPVVDGNGKNLGLVISYDIIKKFLSKPKERMGWGPKGGGNKENPFSMPIKSIMRKQLPDIYFDDSLTDAIKKLLDKKLKGVQILDKDKKVIGMLFRRNVLDRVVEKKFKDGVWLTFSGFPLKLETVDSLKSYLSSNIKRIQRLVPELASINVHIKKLHGATEDKWNYEIDVSLTKLNGQREIVTNQNVQYGYNLMYTLDEALDRLAKLLERKYKKRGGKQYYAKR